MDNYFEINNGDKAREFGQAIIKAVIKTHTIEKRCQELTEEIDGAIESKRKDLMIGVLQKYIQQYKPVLENRNIIRFCAISKQEYDSIGTEEWIKQLYMMKSFIYYYEARKSFAKETIKNCLKKILSSSNHFTKDEIDILLR